MEASRGELGSSCRQEVWRPGVLEEAEGEGVGEGRRGAWAVRMMRVR